MHHLPKERRLTQHQLKVVLGANFTISLVYGTFEAARSLAAHLKRNMNVYSIYSTNIWLEILLMEISEAKTNMRCQNIYLGQNLRS